MKYNKNKGKKWNHPHPRGSLNTSRILNLIRENLTTPLKQVEIIEKTGLSRQTVFLGLERLKSQHLISELANHYLSESDDDFWFGYFLIEYINFFMTKIMEKKQNVSYLAYSPYNHKSGSKNSLDNSILEFSNIIGGLYTYILIQVSSIYDDDWEAAKVKEMINFFFKGVLWENTFYQFRNLFGNSSGNKQVIRNKKEVNKVAESLNNVYPRLYETLENNKIKFFREWIKNDPRDSSLHKNCNHELVQHHMPKCGNYEECVHCRYRRLLK